MERSFKTWQGPLPQELRLAGMQTVKEANRFLREHYRGEFNWRFTVPAAQAGHAFLPVQGQDLDRIFPIKHERVVAQDNTVKMGERVWQIEKTPWRGTLAGCRVLISEHLDGRVSISLRAPRGGPLHGPGGAPDRAAEDLPGEARRGGSWALTSVALRAPSVSAKIARP